MPIALAKNEEDVWIDIERERRARGVAGDVTVTLSIDRRTPHRAKAFVRFQGEAAAWIREQMERVARGLGPRFRVQVNRANADAFRLVVDPNGKFKIYESNGIPRLFLGSVKQWPVEHRDPVAAAEWDCSTDWLSVTMPAGFSKPRAK